MKKQPPRNPVKRHAHKQNDKNSTMKTTPEEKQQGHRYYILQTATGWVIMRVRLDLIDIFLKHLGDFVIAAGDSEQEAMEDLEATRIENVCTSFNKIAERLGRD